MIRRVLSVLALVVAVALSAGVMAPPARADDPLPAPAVAPVVGAVARSFDNPVHDWLPGHRGVDLAGAPGDRVRAAASGTVTFVGVIAGRGVVVVSHGTYRTTYEPVTSSLREGATVMAGEPIGLLSPGHEGCPAAACLHWGLKRGDRYLDPLRLLSPRPDLRLVPRGTPIPQVPGRSGASPAIPVGTNAEARQRIVSFAASHLGDGYVLGATGPSVWDCSSLAQAAYRSAGVSISRVTYTQIKDGTQISAAELQPGDLVFYYDVEHVAIYAGGGEVIHAGSPETGVQRVPLRYGSMVPQQFVRIL